MPRSVAASGQTIVPSVRTVVDTRQPTHDEISLRAFQIYERRGRQPGRESEDWEQARRELVQERNGSR